MPPTLTLLFPTLCYSEKDKENPVCPTFFDSSKGLGILGGLLKIRFLKNINESFIRNELIKNRTNPKYTRFYGDCGCSSFSPVKMFYKDMKKILTQKNMPADFKKAVDNLNRKSIESKITELLTYCSIEKCEVEIRNLIDSLLKSSTYFCNHDHDEIECEVKKNAEAILKKKNLTPSDYTSFVKLLILRQK